MKFSLLIFSLITSCAWLAAPVANAATAPAAAPAAAASALPRDIAAAVAFAAADDDAEPPSAEENRRKHQEGAIKVADDQDDLSADVQQLIIEQTMDKVVELLNEVETIMDEATDRLAEADTGGQTLAAQTEVIEKIHAAAKEKQKQGGGSSKPGGAMMDMMERMMGKKSDEGKGKGKGKGDKPGDEGGEGMTGLSDTANEANGGRGDGKSEARRVPKATGNTNSEIPEEFKQALDAYNRGAEAQIK